MVIDYRTAYAFAAGKLAVALEELRKRGVRLDVAPALVPQRTTEITSFLDQAEPAQNTSLELDVSRLTRELAAEVLEKNKNKNLAVRRGKRIVELQNEIEELKRGARSDDDESEDGSADESDGSNEYTKRVRALVDQRDTLNEKVGTLGKELKEALKGKKEYVEKFTDADTKYKNVKKMRGEVLTELLAIKEAGIDERTQIELSGLKVQVKAELSKNIMLTAEVTACEKTILHEKEVAGNVLQAFYKLRNEFVRETGRDPLTPLPDEVSRPPRACVFPVLTRTVQDAGADSGGEEHPNVDGRKRGRY
jgi:hypothetical protein